MSDFVVSARKYRPIRFDDVVGQEHVSKTLKNALQNDHLAHAFLFCGPRGVGKTTCARILAKVLNCQNVGADHEPCNECSSCLAFNENASFNITELDAASNNSVEHIRALIEQVRFQPQQGKYKVFIIDEVHMLSQQAFNAFLKTLEEPPPYAIFILATTEKHKIIPTILSRCQIFDFKRIQIPAMVAHLQGICEEESIKADKNALHIIAQKADGALRDALSIFDRIVAFSGNSIQYDDVITNLNVLDYDYYFKIIEALLVEDASQVLVILDDILRKGFDADIFINGLTEHLRNILVCKDAVTLQLFELSENLKERYEEQALRTPASFVLTAMNIANDCDINYKMARNKRLHVEMALIKMAYVNRAVELAGMEKKTPDLRGKVPSTPSVSSGPSSKPKIKENTVAVPTKTTPPSSAPVTRVSYSAPKLKGLDAIVAEVKKVESNGHVVTTELTAEMVQIAWNKYIENHPKDSVKNILKNTGIHFEEDTITATVTSTLAEGTLRQELQLMEFLRKELLAPKIILSINVDKSKAPEPPKKQKPLTPKEKFLKMREQNPLMQEMQKRFGLQPDE